MSATKRRRPAAAAVAAEVARLRVPPHPWETFRAAQREAASWARGIGCDAPKIALLLSVSAQEVVALLAGVPPRCAACGHEWDRHTPFGCEPGCEPGCECKVDCPPEFPS